MKNQQLRARLRQQHREKKEQISIKRTPAMAMGWASAGLGLCLPQDIDWNKHLKLSQVKLHLWIQSRKATTAHQKWMPHFTLFLSQARRCNNSKNSTGEIFKKIYTGIQLISWSRKRCLPQEKRAFLSSSEGLLMKRGFDNKCPFFKMWKFHHYNFFWYFLSAH